MKKKRVARSRQLEERRQKRVRMFMGIFIVAIMVASSFAFIIVFYSSGGAHDPAGLGYGFDYRIDENLLYVDVGSQEVLFYSFPDASLDLPDETGLMLRSSDVVVFLFDPNDIDNLPYIEMIRWDFSNYIESNPAAALLAESDDYRFPVANCDRNSRSLNIQVINGTYGIDVDGSCITVSGYQQELLVLRDQLLYEYYDLV